MLSLTPSPSQRSLSTVSMSGRSGSGRMSISAARRQQQQQLVTAAAAAAGLSLAPSGSIPGLPAIVRTKVIARRALVIARRALVMTMLC